MKRASNGRCDDDDDSTEYAHVLQLVVLNALDQWTPHWFCNTMLLVGRAMWSDEVACRATAWFSRLLSPIVEQLCDTRLSHWENFRRLYRHTHLYGSATLCEPQSPGYKYDAYGPVVSCRWPGDAGIARPIMIDFAGACLVLWDSCDAWGDGAWFCHERGYDASYGALLVGRSIRAILRLKSRSDVTSVDGDHNIAERRYFIETTDGMQFPFVRLTNASEWPDGWIDIRWTLNPYSTSLRCKDLPNARLIIVMGRSDADIAQYLATMEQPVDHLFRDEAAQWAVDQYYAMFTIDMLLRDKKVCFASGALLESDAPGGKTRYSALMTALGTMCTALMQLWGASDAALVSPDCRRLLQQIVMRVQNGDMLSVVNVDQVARPYM